MWRSFSGLSKFLIAVLISGKALACADGWPSYSFILLNPDIYSAKQARPVYFSYNSYLVDPVASQGHDEWQLAAEWKKELKLKASVNEINDYFFGQLSDSALAVHVFQKEIKSNKELREFLAFAKKCERNVMFTDFWDEKAFVKRLKALPGLLQEGEKLIAKARTAFWKRKYAFQLIRLSYYSTDHKRFYKYYQAHFGLQKRSNPLDWWATHYYSMVLEQKKEVDSANYIHALVFSHSSNKLAVSRQFYTTRNFDQQLALAQNESERADLLVMQQLTNFSENLESLAYIAGNFPQHPRLGLLLAREANKLDSETGNIYYAHYGYYFEWYFDENRDVREQQLNSNVQRFYSIVRQLRQVNRNIPFLELIEAQAAILSRDYARARQLLKKIKSTDQKIVFQKELLELCVIASSENLHKKSVQDDIGNRLYSLVSHRKNVFFADQMTKSFFDLFSRQLERAGLKHLTAFSSYYANEVFGPYGYETIQHYLDEHNSVEICQNWIEVFNSPKRNRLEQFFCIPFETDNDVKICMARIYFRKGDVANAYRTMNSIDELEIYRPQETHNCFVLVQPYYRAGEPVAGTKEQYAEYKGGEYKRILDMLNKKHKTVRNWMQLGAAFYNTSSDGENYELAHYYASLYPSDQQHQFDVFLWNRSKSYYTKALASNPTAEEKAEIIYMLAYLAMMMNDKTEYERLSGEFEGMQNTSFYRASNCSYTRKKAWPENAHVYDDAKNWW